MKYLVVIILMCASLTVSANISKVAECDGKTVSSTSDKVKAVLFIDGPANAGVIFLQVFKAEGTFFDMSYSRVESSDLDGFPRFFDNDFKLDVTISDEDPEYVDLYRNGELLAKKLKCYYKL